MSVTRWLWHLLLLERSPFPLFIRMAPRAHRTNDGSIWSFLTWYTVIGLYASVIAAPFMFQSVILGVLFVVFGSPAFITMLMALVGAPFVVVGGIFFGLRFANHISGELSLLSRLSLRELLYVAPPGRWGVLRAVSAAALRRRELFFGSGVYEMVRAHRALSIGFALPTGASFIGISLASYIERNPEGITLSDRWVFVLFFVALGVFPPILATLLHLDFRQMLMVGVTAGVFGGTVALERADAWPGALAVMLGVQISGALVISGLTLIVVMLVPPDFAAVAGGTATLAGWGLALQVRERILAWLWQQILQHQGLAQAW